MRPILPPLPLPNELAMPVRDALRGMRKTLSGPLKLMEPVEGALPEPLRQVARRVGGQPQTPRPDPELADVLGLSDFANSRDATARFARTTYQGLKFALNRLGRDDLLISETVAGLAYRTVQRQNADGADPFQISAQIFEQLVGHHVSGVAPGTSIGLHDAEEQINALAVFAVLLWILVDREIAETNEAEVLALCVDVTASVADQVMEASPDRAQLAGLLSTYAGAI